MTTARRKPSKPTGAAKSPAVAKKTPAKPPSGTDPETIVLTGGGELTVELDNQGTLAHNLRVFDGGNDIGGTPTFSGGEPRTGTLEVEPGEYELLCTVGDHAALGMKGKLEVK